MDYAFNQVLEMLKEDYKLYFSNSGISLSSSEKHSLIISNTASLGEVKMYPSGKWQDLKQEDFENIPADGWRLLKKITEKDFNNKGNE